MAFEYNNLKLSELVDYHINNFSKYGVDGFIREDLGKEFSFIFFRKQIEHIGEIYNEVSQINLDKVPRVLAENFSEKSKANIELLEKMHYFISKSDKALEEHKNIIDKFPEIYDSFYESSLPILTISFLEKEKNHESNQVEILKKLKENKIKSDEIISELDSKLKTANETLEKIGVSKYADIFRKESDDYDKKALGWLIASIVILILILGVSIYSYFNITESEKTSVILQYSISKIVVLSALFYALSISNKNYKAHRHNVVMNKHRHNALRTFTTFTEGAGDDIQTKNAVLLEATRTIFSNQQTGYLSQEKDTEPSNKIIEIIKSVTSSASGKSS